MLQKSQRRRDLLGTNSLLREIQGTFLLVRCLRMHLAMQRRWVWSLARELRTHMKVFVVQSCPTPCNSMDCSLPGSYVLGILLARILEWIAIPFSRQSSPPSDWTRVSCIAGRFFTFWATREVLLKDGRNLTMIIGQKDKILENRTKGKKKYVWRREVSSFYV